MAMVMLLGSRTDVMGKFRISTRLEVFGWIATVVMAAASTGFLYFTV
jgi:Mn2+/Fe2+ NRAMP family transporter